MSTIIGIAKDEAIAKLKEAFLDINVLLLCSVITAGTQKKSTILMLPRILFIRRKAC